MSGLKGFGNENAEPLGTTTMSPITSPRMDFGFSVASGPVMMPSGPSSTDSGPPTNCQTSRFSPVTGFSQTSMISSVSNFV